MKTKLFLSNSEIVDSQFINFCNARNIELEAKSLIDFEKVLFTLSFEAEVIFFASPRSVDFFIESISSGSYQLACLGSGTEKRLANYGFVADFVGSVSGNPQKVAEEFKVWVGNRKVLFPISEISNRSISSIFPAHQMKELVIYKTISKPEFLEIFETYVFTSPSNVDSFFITNKLPENAEVIAWGKTTAKKLEDLGISINTVLENSDLRELESHLFQGN